MGKNVDDFDHIFSTLTVERIPVEFISSGYIVTMSGREIKLDGESLRILLTNSNDLSDNDYEKFERLHKMIYENEESDRVEIDILIDYEKFRKEVKKLSKNFLRS